MKTLLAILLSFIVCEAPVLAIHGGYTLGGGLSVIGTYAGVMIPTEDTPLVSATTGLSSGFGTNSLGLFELSMPTDGLGTGGVALFSGNQQMEGTIVASQNPDSAAALIGVINVTGEVQTASFNGGIFFGQASVTQITGNAGGALSASVVAGGVDSPTGTNLTGTANLVVDVAETDTNGNTVLIPTDNIIFQVDGFQQSVSPGLDTSGLPGALGANGAGGGG